MNDMKWPLRKKQLDIPVEFTTHICAYEYDYGHDSPKVVVHIHLPSKRVSVAHYDLQGRIKQHIHNSPMAEEHIKFVCAQDTKLEYLIQVAESMEENLDYINNRRREVYNNTLMNIIKWCLIPCAILTTSYGLYKLFL